MKRLIASALATVGVVALTVLPAVPASAHGSFHSISIRGQMHITDSDWPDSDDHAFPYYSGTVEVSTATPTASIRFTGCADEVRVVLDVTVIHQPFQPWVTTNVSAQLYEGASCRTTDLEHRIRRSYSTHAGTFSDSFALSSGDDGAAITMTVRHSHG